MKKCKSNMQKHFDKKAEAGLRAFADGGLVGQSYEDIGKAAGFPTSPSSPGYSYQAPPTPAPAPAAPAPGVDWAASARAAASSTIPSLRMDNIAQGGKTDFTGTLDTAKRFFGVGTPSKPLYQPTQTIGVRAADGGAVEDIKARGLRAMVRHGAVHYGKGAVEGPGGPTEDKVPAMLSDGEYVIPSDTVEAVGKENLDRLVAENHQPVHQYADGGFVSYTNDGGPMDHDMNPVTRTSLERAQRGMEVARDIDLKRRGLRDLPGAAADTFTGLAGMALGSMVDVPRYQYLKHKAEKAQSVQDQAVRAGNSYADGGLVEEGVRTGVRPQAGVPLLEAPSGPASAPRFQGTSYNPNPIYVSEGGTAVTADQHARIMAEDAARRAAASPAPAPAPSPEIGRAAPGEAPPRPTLRSMAPNVERAAKFVRGNAGSIVGGSLRTAGSLAVPALETMKVAEVANNPKSTVADVATQASSGVARAAGTAAGASLGSLAGPIGTVIGGALGYYAPDALIHLGRKITGTDTEDPAERLRPPSKPTLRAQPEPIDNSAGQPVQDQAPIDPRLIDRPMTVGHSADGNRVAIYDTELPPKMMQIQSLEGRQAQLRKAYAPTQYNDEPSTNPSLRRDPTAPAGPTTWSEFIDGRRASREALARDKIASDERNNARTLGVTLRGQDVTAKTAQDKLSFEQSQERQRQMNSDRDYNLNREKFSGSETRAESESRDRAYKAMHERVTSMIPPTTDANGKQVPDTAKAAQYMTGLNALLGEKIAQMEASYKKTRDPRTKQWLDRAKRDNVQALDESDVRRFIVGMQADEIARQEDSGWWNPIGGTAVDSQAPITSLRRKPGIFFDDYETNRGDIIPARKIDKRNGLRNHDFDILKRDR